MESSYKHAPESYDCPFCHIVQGHERPGNGTKQRDIVYQNAHVTAFIASKWWPNNQGHVLVIPNAHFENLFDLPERYAVEIHRAAQLAAFGMKPCMQAMGFITPRGLFPTPKVARSTRIACVIGSDSTAKCNLQPKEERF